MNQDFDEPLRDMPDFLEDERYKESVSPVTHEARIKAMLEECKSWFAHLENQVYANQAMAFQECVSAQIKLTKFIKKEFPE